MPSPGDSLPGATRVLRLLLAKRPFFASADHLEPSFEAFMPSTADKEEASRRALPVGVSVFQVGATTVAEAVAIRRRASGQPLGLVRPFEIGVDRLVDVGAAHGRALDVVHDPLTAPETRDLPGAEGHAAARGLDRGDMPRTAYRAMLDALAVALAEGRLTEVLDA